MQTRKLWCKWIGKKLKDKGILKTMKKPLGLPWLSAQPEEKIKLWYQLILKNLSVKLDRASRKEKNQVYRLVLKSCAKTLARKYKMSAHQLATRDET